MPNDYVPASLAELYEQRAVQHRRKHRNRRLVIILWFTALIALDVYLFWPMS